MDQEVCCTLVQSQEDSLQKDILSQVRTLKSTGRTAIFVSINKPYPAMYDAFAKNGISSEKLFFLDCITPPQEGFTDYVSFAPNLSDLSSLSIAISRIIDSVPGEKFLVIDAVHTLWIYHTPDVIARFMQNLAEESYNKKMKLVAFMVDSEDKRLERKLVPFFDQMIKLKDG
jgi:hypothetical protein